MKFLALFALVASASAGFSYTTGAGHPGFYNYLGGYTTGFRSYAPVYSGAYSPAVYKAYAPANNFGYSYTTAHHAAAPVITEVATPVLKTVAPVAAAVVPAAVPAVTPYHGAYKTINYAPTYAATARYHEQNEIGEYKFGYQGDTSARDEHRTADGVVTGQYSYLDANNVPQQVNYVADALGFRVAATNLPVDANTPVAAAHVAHVAAPVVHETVAHAAPVTTVYKTGAAILDEHNPHVPYTPEVAAARANHLAALHEATVRVKRSAEPSKFYGKSSYGRSSYGRGGYSRGSYRSYGGGYSKGYRSGGYRKW